MSVAAKLTVTAGEPLIADRIRTFRQLRADAEAILRSLPCPLFDDADLAALAEPRPAATSSTLLTNQKAVTP